MKRIKQIYKISKRVMKKMPSGLFEGRKVEGSGKNRRRYREFQRQEVEWKKPSLNQSVLALESSMWHFIEDFFVNQIFDRCSTSIA